MERTNTKSPGPMLECCVKSVVRVMEPSSQCSTDIRFLILSHNSGSGTGLGLVALGKDDRIAWCWTLGPPV
ncbi:hypothetical protein F2Q70_00014683 [Brassica cretica]|uniref:Uncharacterized protein n=1 Tax=Brassica cretica TaxID=69181 RepID=A0A8S9HX86_BRACR|nr:hypothetical protein F2Q70_00014683 [Brassica cretica]